MYLLAQVGHLLPGAGVVHGEDQDEGVGLLDGEGAHGGEGEGARRVQDVEGERGAVGQRVLGVVQLLHGLAVLLQVPGGRKNK